ncbi:50S ribosomal protein L29 [Candidatus Saccharibacteria bacterium]|nr:50S ribosomal protein L29 [Candidatus Saccharibacteria bacterium]
MATKTTVKKAKKAVKEIKTVEQLRQDLIDKTKALSDARRSLNQGELVNPRFITVTRKEIARINTAIRAAEIAKLKEDK